MLKIKGTTVFLNTILDIISGFKGISNYFIRIGKQDELSDHVTVIVSMKENSPKEQIILDLKNRLRGILKVTPEIETSKEEKIKSLQTGKGTKKRFYEDRR